MQLLDFYISREREREPLLSRFLGDSTVGILRAKTWTSVLRSFDKLREVRVLSYLGFTLYLSVL